MFSKLMLITMFILANHAYAGSGVDPSTLKYKNWGDNKPNTTTVFSKKMPLNLRLFSAVWSTGVDWQMKGRISNPEFRAKLCAIETASECRQLKPYGAVVIEEYLGPAEGFVPAPFSNDSRVGVESLKHIGDGAKKVLLLSIIEGRMVRESVTVSFDSDISDNDLRQVALEEGVYRVFGFRED